MTRPSACGTRSIWRAASLLISQHGGTAVSEATRLAGRMLDRGDSEGWQVLCVDQPGDRDATGAAPRATELR
jgi:hypothetical protein